MQSISSATSVRKNNALQVVVNAGRGLSEVLKTNLGPKGTLKMLVSGAGAIKLTKDGSVLLQEMQIQHPCAQMIARAATAQDDIAGDGTTATILLIGELLKQADRYIADGLHSRLLTEGFELAKKEALAFLDKFSVVLEQDPKENRELYVSAARSAVGTKVQAALAGQLAEISVDAVTTIRRAGEAIDLHMVEIMHMPHRLGGETSFVAGLVLDHGSRHPDMPKRLENCYILTCNVSLEYEKTEATLDIRYTTAEEKERLMRGERKTVDDRVRQLINLKRQLCTKENGKSFVIINQKGIDPPALDMLAKENIIALRRAKKRNMERLVLACGGAALNSFDGITEQDLGYAGSVYEHILGEEKYTFVEDVNNPRSCTILVKGNGHTIAQIKDAIRDGLRAVKNAIDDRRLVPGGGAFELACAQHLEQYIHTVQGRAKFGVAAFKDALLIIPKCLAESCGFDTQFTVVELQEKHAQGLQL